MILQKVKEHEDKFGLATNGAFEVLGKETIVWPTSSTDFCK